VTPRASLGPYPLPSGPCDFYFEYDRGTESTAQLSDKLAGYMGVVDEAPEAVRPDLSIADPHSVDACGVRSGRG
jgi:hypothetical protein